MHILVSTASKHGATREIAEAIADELRRAGNDVDIAEPDLVRDCSAYDAVVLGSAVYGGRWMPSARRFGERHRTALRQRPVWLFSSGPIGTPLTPDEPPSDAVRWARELGARDHRVFAGRVDGENLDFAERIITRMVRSPDGDFRDWELIREWARTIAPDRSGSAKDVAAVAGVEAGLEERAGQ
ncbi:MAG: flavodoxin domain-containing protein [Chloroflexi bacterium]|nr:flavodoxin domain-containing protein [Chloroflexota bacterium]